MAFSDLCHISNAYKVVENESDQSERIMEENSMVRDLITKILDETGPTEGNSSIQPPEKTISGLQHHYPKNDSGTFIPPPNVNYQNMYNFAQNDSNGFNFNLQNGFGNNGFINYNENDPLLGMDPVDPEVTPEQLNLLRLAAQEIGGAQFTNPPNPNKFDYNFFEPHQRNSLPEPNMFQNNFNRPNSLNLDMNFNANYENPFNNVQQQRFPNKFDNAFMKDQNQDSSEILAYLNQLNMSLERRDEPVPNNMDFKMPMEVNGHYQNEDFNKIQDDRSKVYFNRFQPPPKNFSTENNFYLNEMMNQTERNHPNFDFTNQPPNSAPMNFKPNGFHQIEFMQRRDINQPMRDGFQPNGGMEQRNFENVGRENMQQAALMRQNQELARQMSLLMRNRPPPNQLNVDVSFLHENAPFNLGLGALLGPNSVPPPVLPSPMLDLPLLAPFYAMRNMRGAATSSGILHARLDACYEQWRQLERERKRTEARLALAYPGRCVSSSNSIPVPRLPPCPTRVDRLTVDMLREHTKVLTLMGKMETLRASCAASKRPSKPEDSKITVLKRGQENVASEKEKNGMDPASFDPMTWREDVRNLSEIAPHSEVESAMLAWRNAVAGVQAARRRELAPHHPATARYIRTDPIIQLADAVKQLCICARRARCAMWCDLTLTVALAPPHTPPPPASAPVNPATTNTVTKVTVSDNPHSIQAAQPKRAQDTNSSNNNHSKPTNNDAKEESDQMEDDLRKMASRDWMQRAESRDKPPNDPKSDKSDANKSQTTKPTDKQDKHPTRRSQNYRKLNQGRNDFYQKNPRYDNRFMHNRQPYYLATGPIN